MSLREQLLKSGLATKQQAKRAERDAKKKQHSELVAKKQAVPSSEANASEAVLHSKLEEQREADRERNRIIELEKTIKESRARAIDIMVNNDLCDERAKLPYYFRYHETKIGCIRVNEVQQVLLAQGQLAIASFDVEFKFFLLSPENAAKIHACDPGMVHCFFAGSDPKPSDAD